MHTTIAKPDDMLVLQRAMSCQRDVILLKFYSTPLMQQHKYLHAFETPTRARLETLVLPVHCCRYTITKYTGKQVPKPTYTCLYRLEYLATYNHLLSFDIIVPPDGQLDINYPFPAAAVCC